MLCLLALLALEHWPLLVSEVGVMVARGLLPETTALLGIPTLGQDDGSSARIVMPTGSG